MRICVECVELPLSYGSGILPSGNKSQCGIMDL